MRFSFLLLLSAPILSRATTLAESDASFHVGNLRPNSPVGVQTGKKHGDSKTPMAAWQVGDGSGSSGLSPEQFAETSYASHKQPENSVDSDRSGRSEDSLSSQSEQSFGSVSSRNSESSLSWQSEQSYGSVSSEESEDSFSSQSEESFGSVHSDNSEDSLGSEYSRTSEASFSFDRSTTGSKPKDVDIEDVLKAAQIIKVPKGAPRPTVINDGVTYTLGHIIGQGGNSVVLEGHDVHKVKYALKFSLQRSEAGADDLGNEFAALRRLQFMPSIVRLYGEIGLLAVPKTASPMSDTLRAVERVRFIVLEGLSKSTSEVTPFFGDKKLPERHTFVRSFAYAALLILEQVHKAGYAHCDIHQDAFMKDSEERWRLIDFGKSRENPQAGERGMVEDGQWKTRETLWLLSLFELNDRQCTFRDDLVRLAETLFRIWPNTLSIRGYVFLKAEIDGDIPTALSRVKCWKRRMSFQSIYPDDMEAAGSYVAIEDKKQYIPIADMRIENHVSPEVAQRIQARREATRNDETCSGVPGDGDRETDVLNFVELFYERALAVETEDEPLPYEELRNLLIDSRYFDNAAAEKFRGMYGEQ